MEFMGFQQAINHLLGLGLAISTFISDRHTTIACSMKKDYANITHYFDLWHIKKSMLITFNSYNDNIIHIECNLEKCEIVLTLNSTK